jgi:signal transduction histidine kinase
LNTIQDDIDLIRRIPVVPAILEIICKTTGMGFAAIARVTGEKWVACAVRDGISFGLGSGDELELETTICNDIRLTQRPVVIDHVDQDVKYANHPTPILYGFQSYISVPLLRKDGRFFGTLCAIDPQPNQLNTPETIGMFNLYADLISYHLQTMEALSLNETRLASELKTDEIRDQFIAILGHDLRNPLSAISMSSELLKESQLSHSDMQLVSIIDRSAHRMGGLIDNILDFAKARLGNGIGLNRTNSEPLEQILKQVVSENEASHPRQAIHTKFDIVHPIYCDSNRIAELFSNLLGNALTYGNQNTPVIVHATSCDGIFILSVSNSGPKISSKIRERLFQPFARGEAKPENQGLGLGLYISAEIARAHDGNIEVYSSDSETIFTLKMPAGLLY